MLSSLKNIDSSYKQTRIMVICFSLFVTSICLYCVYSTFKSQKEGAERIYILDEGSIISAQSKNIEDNRPVEARSHIDDFHKYFYTLSPDEKAIKSNIGKALDLSDKSVKDIYDRYLEHNYYNGVIAGNISQTIKINEIILDESVTPWKATCSATIEIVRTSSITHRNLKTVCYLRTVSRSDKNPHGFLIESYQVLDNSDIKTVAR